MNKIAKVFSLEYTDILKAFFRLHYLGRCCINVIRGHCCVFSHFCTNVIPYNFCATAYSNSGLGRSCFNKILGFIFVQQWVPTTEDEPYGLTGMTSPRTPKDVQISGTFKLETFERKVNVKCVSHEAQYPGVCQQGPSSATNVRFCAVQRLRFDTQRMSH